MILFGECLLELETPRDYVYIEPVQVVRDLSLSIVLSEETRSLFAASARPGFVTCCSLFFFEVLIT